MRRGKERRKESRHWTFKLVSIVVLQLNVSFSFDITEVQ